MKSNEIVTLEIGHHLCVVQYQALSYSNNWSQYDIHSNDKTAREVEYERPATIQFENKRTDTISAMQKDTHHDSPLPNILLRRPRARRDSLR